MGCLSARRKKGTKLGAETRAKMSTAKMGKSRINISSILLT